MAGKKPGSIRGGGGYFSIWRIPNVLLETRGSFLGEPDAFVGRVNRIRSLLGVLFLIGMIVYYSGLRHLTSGTDDKGVRMVTGDTPEGHWFLGVIVSVTLAVFILPVVGLVLVLCARRGSRLRTLRSLCWPLVAIGGYFGLLVAMSGLVGAGNALTAAASKLDLGIRFAAWAVTVVLAILCLVWLVKAFYLAATGLFRADDGHPLLAPIIAPVVAWATAGIMLTTGSDGLSGVPRVVGWITGLGGPLSITALSVLTLLHLRRKYRAQWPFRAGPLGSPVGPSLVDPAAVATA